MTPPLLHTQAQAQAMGEANKILRTSIHAFLHGYPSFTSVAGLLVLPVSASLLLSQSLITSSPSSLQLISSRVRSLFHAAAFPSSSPLFSLLNLMFSQTIFSSIFTLPFTLTFLLIAKASVIDTLCGGGDRKSSPLSLYFPLLLTHLFNSFLILSANATIFTLLFLLFNAAELAGLSSSSALLVMSLTGAVLYSVVLANTVVACNLAIFVSAMDKCSGYVPVLRACVLIKGMVATALSIALPTSLALAAVEALFQYRVMRAYHLSSEFSVSILGEAFTIAYMHAVITVVEIIASWFFYRSCRLSCRENWDQDWCGYQVELEPEDKGHV